MLKITRLPDKPTLSKNNDSRSVFNKNNNSKPASRKNNDNDEVNKFDISENDVEYTKKLGILSKSKKSKRKKTFKS